MDIAERWREHWREYDLWAEQNQPLDRRPFECILRDLDVLYRQFPLEVRQTDPDPEKLGVQRYHQILAAHERIRSRT